MAPGKKFKSSVIVFDVNSKDDFKQKAIQCYRNICGESYFYDNLNSSQLILINTSETNNKKNDDNPTKYNNIVVATDMVAYDLSNVKHIEDATPSVGNWLEGIEVAADELISSTKSSSFERCQLIVLSDLSTKLDMSKEEIKKAVKDIRRNLSDIDAYIYFLGPDIPVPKMLRSKKDVYDWVQNLDVQGENSNVQVAVQILEECNGVICDLDMGLDLLQSYINGKRGYPFTEPLKFDDLDIITACIKLLNCQSLLSLRRDKEGLMEKVYVLAEDQSKEVDASNVIRGIALHNKLVVIPQDVNKGVKDYSRFFKLLGFTDKSNVPEVSFFFLPGEMLNARQVIGLIAHWCDYLMATSTSIVMPYDTKDPEIGAVNYIIKACLKQQKYGIALRAYKENTGPKLYCLIPKEDPLCFYAVELPYAEDVHIMYETTDCEAVKFKEESYGDYDNVGELKDDIYAYLDSVSLEGKVKLHPSLRQNFNKRRTVSNLLRKIKDEELENVEIPLGDLRINFPEGLYDNINQKWFPKGEVAMDEDDAF
ncbi:ku autoantigen dna helicase [Holotrichia oblita]|uniref:Ku autoantigen dna helicase n=1 Tax=Holotrichia oblita TaxID=644536 RepID=A0ACB9TBI6_HOLOL|nr:ku autoantigen dna helicase [Holotrichia oblita]